MKKVIIRIILIIIACVFCAMYVGYQIYNSYFAKIKTETAIYSTVYDSIDTNCFIIRDESVLYNKNEGIINYTVENGQKVSSSGTVAKVYKNEEDVVNQKEIDKIDEEIKGLKQLNLSASKGVTDLTVIDDQIFDHLKEVNMDINENKCENINFDINNTLYLISQRGMLTGEISTLDDRINELKQKRDTLVSAISGQEAYKIISDKSGYFVSKIDGLENKFDYKNALSLYPKDIDDALNSLNNNLNDEDAIGKVINSVDWYIACNVANDEVFHFAEGDNLSLVFPFLSSEKIPARVVAINQMNNEDKATIILCCDYMSKDLSLLRSETVRVNIESHKGIVINKKALHEDVITKVTKDEDGNDVEESKKVQGVYTLYGKEIMFKQVISTYANDNYIICDDDPLNKELFKPETVKAHDEVVVEGANLYNGKVVR